MEKYARQAVSEGVKSVDDIHISMDSEIYRVLNLHYNRNNHIEVCSHQAGESVSKEHRIIWFLSFEFSCRSPYDLPLKIIYSHGNSYAQRVFACKRNMRKSFLRDLKHFAWIQVFLRMSKNMRNSLISMRSFQKFLNVETNLNFNYFQVPPNFRFVVEQTLREFFRAIQGGKDTEQSWKKSIYKVISRMDDPVPEYFKSPNFLEQLE